MKPILIADDDAAIVDVVTIILEEEGQQVVAAASEREIFERLRKTTPLFILLDVTLGGSDGRTIAKQLKSSQKTREIPVIISSAHANIEEIAKTSGADGYLSKPFEIDELTTLVRRFTTQ